LFSSSLCPHVRVGIFLGRAVPGKEGGFLLNLHFREQFFRRRVYLQVPHNITNQRRAFPLPCLLLATLFNGGDGAGKHVYFNARVGGIGAILRRVGVVL